MRETKRRMELFSSYDRRGMELHMERMAAEGWLIEEISTFTWKYRRIEPKKLHFCVTFHPDASEFEPEPSENELEFEEFCRHTGWVLAMKRASMLVFYNERENPTPIETEPEVEIDAIHTGMVKTVLVPYLVLAVMALVAGGVCLFFILQNPAVQLANAGAAASVLEMGALLLLCMVEIGGYYLWRFRARRAAVHGEFLESGRWATLFQRILVIFVILVFAGMLVSLAVQSGSAAARVLLTTLVYAVGAVLINGVRNALRKRKASPGVNKVVSFLVGFLFLFTLLMVVNIGMMVLNDTVFADSDEESYEYEGNTFTAYHDELPLTLEELLGIPSDGYSMRRWYEGSFLLQRSEMSQYPRFDAEDFREMPDMSYTVTHISVPALYGICREDLLNDAQNTVSDGEVIYRDFYEPVDPVPWGAKEAYRRYHLESYTNQYLLFYSDRIIEIRFSWEPDEQQMQTAAEKLLAGQ